MWGFPGVTSSKESTCQCRRLKRNVFDPWVKKILWRREWLPNLVLLCGKFHGQQSLAGYSPWGRRVGKDWVTNTFTFKVYIHCETPTLSLSLEENWWFYWFKQLPPSWNRPGLLPRSLPMICVFRPLRLCLFALFGAPSKSYGSSHVVHEIDHLPALLGRSFMTHSFWLSSNKLLILP